MVEAQKSQITLGRVTAVAVVAAVAIGGYTGWQQRQAELSRAKVKTDIKVETSQNPQPEAKSDTVTQEDGSVKSEQSSSNVSNNSSSHTNVSINNQSSQLSSSDSVASGTGSTSNISTSTHTTVINGKKTTVKSTTVNGVTKTEISH